MTVMTKRMKMLFDLRGMAVFSLSELCNGRRTRQSLIERRNWSGHAPARRGQAVSRHTTGRRRPVAGRVVAIWSGHSFFSPIHVVLRQNLPWRSPTALSPVKIPIETHDGMMLVSRRYISLPPFKCLMPELYRCVLIPQVTQGTPPIEFQLGFWLLCIHFVLSPSEPQPGLT